ncbi:uncharacterized protein F5147DRAFT_372395 [Suillus discolor]|uniref:Uncharacterized protein n=1 Tax=Suillus discolor TaxID=1912936 RepID=A0A9P7EYZ9_9AGAM|nr:uncharacterized protein F5147DRAFT_372395 [Suillus discolor]KAG2096980.1 hypothetical protein F5147DRAFT_372395 [Suillus discolor]
MCPMTISSSRPQYVPPQYLYADWLPQSTPPDLSPSLAKSPPNAYSPAKGHTMFEQLKEHSVVWEQTLDVMVQMGITRETNGPLDNNIFRTRPRTLNLYANKNLSSSSVSTISTHLDTNQLPNTRGIRRTEKLVEALFNPVPVTSPGQLTPFTYLHEPSAQLHDHFREPVAEDRYIQVYGEGEDEARLADESLYSNSTSVDLNHPIPARLDLESDYQSVHLRWTSSLRAPSVKSMAARSIVMMEWG